MASCRRAAGIDERVLADDEVGQVGELAAPDFVHEIDEVVDAFGRVNDGALSRLLDAPRHRCAERPVELERAEALFEALHA